MPGASKPQVAAFSLGAALAGVAKPGYLGACRARDATKVGSPARRRATVSAPGIRTSGAYRARFFFADRQLRVVRHLGPHVGERDTRRGARDPADDAAVVHDLGLRLDLAVDAQDAQRPVDVATVVQARDRLLTRVAALAERDVRVGQPRLRRQHPLV